MKLFLPAQGIGHSLDGGLGHQPRLARQSNPMAVIGAVLLIVLLAALSGLVVALYGVPAAVAVLALFMVVAALVVPLQLFFYLFIGVVFVGVGQLQYFARVDKAFWVPYLLAALLYLRLLMAAGGAGRQGNARPQTEGASRVAVASVALFLFTAVASSLINEVPPLQWLVAGKEYFLLWSVLLAFGLGVVGLRHIETLVRALPWFLALQVPVVVYQRFVVAAQRVGGSPWDAVVGLFGGNPEAGGASGTMAIFSLVAVVLMVEAWKAGKAGGWRALLTCAFALTACALAEVKLVIVMLPLLLLLVFGAELLRRPALALAGLLVTGVLTVGLLSLYQQQFTSTRTKEGRSVAAYVETIIERNSSAQLTAVGYAEMGRAAALGFWWRNQSLTDPAGFLVGHGVGSSRIGGLVVGDLVKRYQARIARSALVVYLWEVGVIGTGGLVFALLAGVFGARRLSRRPGLEGWAWLLRASALGLGLVLMTLPYGPDFVEVSQLQIMAMLLLGVVLAAARLPVDLPTKR